MIYLNDGRSDIYIYGFAVVPLLFSLALTITVYDIRTYVG